jgi:hypothetical protein
LVLVSFVQVPDAVNLVSIKLAPKAEKSGKAPAPAEVKAFVDEPKLARS